METSWYVVRTEETVVVCLLNLFAQANILGSTIGLTVADYLERYYRARREVRDVYSLPRKVFILSQIHRLYRPLNTSGDLLSDEEEDDLEAGTQLLPVSTDSNQRASVPKPATKSSRIEDVWDEREELFDIGDESDEEDNARSPTKDHTTTA